MANTNIYDMADTWNAAGTTFTAIKMNVTDTASAAASLLLDLQVGGASKFKVSKSGQLLASNGTQAAPGISFITNPGTGIVCFGDILGITAGGLRSVYIDGSQIRLRSTGTFGWAPDGNNNSTGDLFLEKDAAGILAQRNGTNAQASRLYFSFTDAANYTRLALKTATGVHTLETESAGTGEANIDLALTPKGTGRVRFGTLTASADAPVTGYIEVKDSGGTVRKLAVIA